MTQPSTSQQQFANDRIELTVQIYPSCRVEYNLKMDPKLAQEAYAHALKKVAKEVSFPGFRKGKAPEHVLAKNFPKEIERAWHEKAAQLAIQESQHLTHIPIVLPEKYPVTFRMHTCSIEQGATMLLSFDTYPMVPKPDPQLFAPQPLPSPTIDERAVLDFAEKMRLFFAQWRPVTSRPIQEGDFVVIDLDLLEEEGEQRALSQTRFEVSAKGMARWMQEWVIGKQAGDTVEGLSGIAEEGEEGVGNGWQQRQVRLHIRKVEEPTHLMSLEELANQLRLGSVDQLKESINTLLHKREEVRIKEDLREQAAAFLLERYPFPLPSTLIQEEVRHRFEHMIQQPAAKKEWESSSEAKRKELMQQLMEEAQKALRLFYLCQQITQSENIHISAEEVENYSADPFAEVLSAFSSSSASSTAKSALQQAKTLSLLIVQKAQDWLVEQRVEATLSEASSESLPPPLPSSIEEQSSQIEEEGGDQSNEHKEEGGSIASDQASSLTEHPIEKEAQPQVHEEEKRGHPSS